MDTHTSETSGKQSRHKPQAVSRFSHWRDKHRLRTSYIPLTAKLTTLVFLIIMIAGIFMTFAAHQLVYAALMDQMNTQLIQEAESVRKNVALIQRQASRRENIFNRQGFSDSTDSSDSTASKRETQQALNDFLEAQGTNGPTDYFMQIRDAQYRILATPFTSIASNNLISIPRLSSSSSIVSQVPLDGEAVIVPARVTVLNKKYDQAAYVRASTDWLVRAISIPDPDTGETQYVVYIAKSLYWVNDAVSRIVRYFIIVDVAVIICGALLALLSIRQALKPLKRIEKTAAQIAAGDLSQRVPAAPTNTEIGSLSSSLNAMLSRIEGSFKKQEETTEQMKRFVSDASHELRTPLAAIHGYAELYKMQRDTPGALERADTAIDHIETSSTRMSSLVEALLSLARLDEGRGIDLGQKMRLDQIIKEAAEDLHALDPQRTITLGRVAVDQTSMLSQIAAVAAGTSVSASAEPENSDDDQTDFADRFSRTARSSQDSRFSQDARFYQPVRRGIDKTGANKTNKTGEKGKAGGKGKTGDKSRGRNQNWGRGHNLSHTLNGNLSRGFARKNTASSADTHQQTLAVPVEKRLSIVPGTVPEVSVGGDPTRIRQVVTNIIGNIHRYTPADSPVEIGVSLVKAVTSSADLSKYDPSSSTLAAFLEDVAVAKKTNSGREFAIIHVSDHGPGVNSEKMTKIFERFYTTDPSRARQKGGSGLGMSIALAVVKAHHGFICATTTPGGGLSFTIIIPSSQTRMFLDNTAGSDQPHTSVEDARKNRQAQKRRRKQEQHQQEQIRQIVYKPFDKREIDKAGQDNSSQQ